MAGSIPADVAERALTGLEPANGRCYL